MKLAYLAVIFLNPLDAGALVFACAVSDRIKAMVIEAKNLRHSILDHCEGVPTVIVRSALTNALIEVCKYDGITKEAAIKVISAQWKP